MVEYYGRVIVSEGIDPLLLILFWRKQMLTSNTENTCQRFEFQLEGDTYDMAVHFDIEWTSDSGDYWNPPWKEYEAKLDTIYIEDIVCDNPRQLCNLKYKKQIFNILARAKIEDTDQFKLGDWLS